MTPSQYLSMSERLDRIEDMVKALVEFHSAITEQETSRALEKVRMLSEVKDRKSSPAEFVYDGTTFVSQELSSKKDLTTPHP